MFSVLSYNSKNKKTKNIGDYIQSVAASQYSDTDYTLINREELNNYTGSKTKIILNGWFMHSPENWPPSNNIIPLFLSFHISPSVEEKMLSQEGIDYLKKYEPIGCRDYRTLELLRKKGVKSYFSSCLTTTLGRTYTREITNNDICFVDPFYPQYSFKNPIMLLSSMYFLLRNFRKIRAIAKKKYPEENFKGAVKAAQFYKVYSKKFADDLLLGARYICHCPKLSLFSSEESKFKYADELLRYYSGCNFLVTSRIHAALPCLGMDVPVIFVDHSSFDSRDNPERGRFKGLVDLMNVLICKNDDLYFLNPSVDSVQKIGLDFVFENPKEHLKYTDSLASKCIDFVRASIK